MYYSYTAINDIGRTVNGTISAESMDNAISELKDRKYYIVDINEGSALQKEIKLSSHQRVKAKDLSFFCRQMATMLKAGINVLTSLDLIRNQTANKKLKIVLNHVYEMVEKGNPVCFSMGQHPDVFPLILVNMVEAGEISGSIDESFRKMAVYFEKQAKLGNKIKNALVYPAVILIVAVAVINILMIFVLPTFVGMFRDMNIKIPSVTMGLINFGTFMRDYWYLVILSIFSIAWAYNIYNKTPSGGVVIGRLKLKIPVFGGVITNSETSSFTRTLSTLIASGVSLIPALYTTQKLISNRYIASEFENVIQRVKEGENLSRPIQEMGIFPPLVPVMIKTGEESGNLEMMLEQLSDFYEEEMDNSVTRLTALFEPFMMVFLAVIVGFLLASIILPMFQIYGSIK